VAVLDKSEGFSANGGPLFAETSSACINLDTRPKMVDIVYGLGGRDFTVDQATRVFRRLENIAATGVVGPVYSHMGQRDLRAEVQ
jgi:pyruvate ferredoxin oxidoreductase alpha subunit